MKIHIWTAGSGLMPGKAMNICLWAVQGLLALVFAMAGSMKVLKPMADLAVMMPWTSDVPALLVRFIGVCEYAGALGILLPSVTRIRPDLTSQAGLSLATVMTLATLFHVSRGEFGLVFLPVILGALALFVAWGRFYIEPIAPKE